MNSPGFSLSASIHLTLAKISSARDEVRFLADNASGMLLWRIGGAAVLWSQDPTKMLQDVHCLLNANRTLAGGPCGGDAIVCLKRSRPRVRSDDAVR
jgi:hypothetical protein